MSSPEHKQKIWNYIKDIKVAMMVTDDEGDLHARPMHLVQDDYDGTIWFFTRADAQKIDELHHDRRVCLTFCDQNKGVHVSLSGRGRISRDSNVIEKFWSPVVAAWFPEGKSSPDCALLEIKISKGEYWDATGNPIKFLYEVTKANVSDQEPDLGENQKFG